MNRWNSRLNNARNNDGRGFIEAHEADVRLAVIKKTVEPGADKITREQINKAMEEFQSRKDKT